MVVLWLFIELGVPLLACLIPILIMTRTVGLIEEEELLNGDKARESEYISIIFPKPLTILLFGITLLIYIFIIWCCKNGEQYFGLFAMVVALVTNFLAIYFAYWKIDYYKSEDYFVYRSITRGKKKIYYSECINFKWDKKHEFFYVKTVGDKKYFVPAIAINYDWFRVRMIHMKIKEIQPPKKKIKKRKPKDPNKKYDLETMIMNVVNIWKKK